MARLSTHAIKMGLISEVRNVPGVYVLFDLDGRALYVGQSRKLRTRLEQHFVSQNSSATADGLLDIYDVLKVAVWYAQRRLALFAEDNPGEATVDRMEPLDILEAAVHREFQPRWNRAKPAAWAGSIPSLTYENADVVVGVLDSPEEVAVRRQPLERIEAKLLHLIRAVRKAKISGASPGVRKALSRHAEELGELFQRLHE